jgi:uncharacterized protein (TIGR03067 family)
VSTLLLALALGAPAPKADAKPPADEHPLMGEWVVESEVYSGKPKNVSKRAGVILTSDRWKIKIKGETESCLSVDPKKDPPTIDVWVPVQGDEEESRSRCKGIYKLEGDTLTICYSYKDRPTKFESPAKSEIWLMKLKRVKSDVEPGEKK